jgi:hypothetical protein
MPNSSVMMSRLVREILSGKEKTIPHSGFSQYRDGGTVSCGLAALHFIRIVLKKSGKGHWTVKMLSRNIPADAWTQVASTRTH